MTRTLRSVFSAILIAGSILAFTMGVVAPALPTYVGRPDVERTIKVDWPAKPLLRLTNSSGMVYVTTGSKDKIQGEVDILGYERVDGSVRCGQKYLDDMVCVKEEGAVLRIVAEPKDRPDNLDVMVDFRLEVPEGTHLEIESLNGNVWVARNCGDVTIRGRNTDIEITSPRGDVVANSTNGRIRVVDASRDTTLETVNGNVYAHMNGGSLQASTMNGTVVARVLGPEVRFAQLTSQNGDITLVLNKVCSAFVEARTERGAVESDIPVDSSHGVCKSRHLEGNIGRGQMYLSMDTLNGNVRIRKEN